MPLTSQAHVSRRHVLRLLAGVCGLGVAAVANADSSGYQKIFDLSAASDLLQVQHHHDWSLATREARWKMISTHKNPLGGENDYSWLEIYDLSSGTRVRRPVPALTYLWISPDSRFVVGLSNIKLWNPLQLVVFDRRGRLLYSKEITSQSWRGIGGSVTNWVEWYMEPKPAIRIEALGTSALLYIETNTGGTQKFSFELPLVEF